jgi:hypothetical protein
MYMFGLKIKDVLGVSFQAVHWDLRCLNTDTADLNHAWAFDVCPRCPFLREIGTLWLNDPASEEPYMCVNGI